MLDMLNKKSAPTVDVMAWLDHLDTWYFEL